MTVRYLTNQEEVEARGFMLQAVAQARRALCLRAKCGTVIVKNGEVIGFGYNAPPLDRADQQICLKEFGIADKPKYDRTCCLHAEWRAILDALKRYSDQVSGARLYFVRVDDRGNVLMAGEPFCTVCSRLALDVGIAEFLLWREQGIAAYPTDEYNRVSYAYYPA